MMENIALGLLIAAGLTCVVGFAAVYAAVVFWFIREIFR